MTEWRVLNGDHFQFVTAASNAQQCFIRIVVTEDGGEDRKYEALHTPNTDRTLATTAVPGTVRHPGFVTRATAGIIGSGVKRGEIFGEMGIQDRTDRNVAIMASGYVGDAHNLNLGHFRTPTEGKGFLDWIQEANDAAGSATTTVNLAATNARRLVRAIIIKYHASGDSATRTLTMTLRDLADSGGPTGWSIASDTWVSPTLTLTVNEEGLMHVGEHGFVSTNDAGTLVYADNTTAPNPFPFFVEEGETADLIIAVGSGHANDDYDVWVQYEEWIEI